MEIMSSLLQRVMQAVSGVRQVQPAYTRLFLTTHQIVIKLKPTLKSKVQFFGYLRDWGR